MKPITKQIDLGDGRIVTLETGKIAKQADGSVVVRMGDCMLLATAVAAKEAKEDVDFMPLTIDYQEKYASAGRFPGGFFKREARLSEYEILICRIVDRALRPLFPEDFHADTQVMISLISGDKDVMPDCLVGLAASAALMISDIPFNGPISEVRVCRIDGKFVINPSITDIAKADIDLIVAANPKDIVMVEGEMSEVSENDMLDAIKTAHEAIKIQCQAQIEFRELCGNKPKRTYNHEKSDDVLKETIRKATYDKVYAIAKSALPKAERSEKFKAVKEEFVLTMTEEERIANKFLIKKYFHDVERDAVRDMILNDSVRLDGRKQNQIRPIWSETGYLPSPHGSALFTRGETQSLTTVTLGSTLDEQKIDGATFEGTNRFILHYNFPGFSTGEVKPNRGTSRREVGHGNLALRSLKKVMPGDDLNPYTIRIVSDILESNGSSSMATVCAGTLALMDAGIKINRPVSGIAMGLITDGKKFAVLSDILGDEDHLGDMDFKVTGTEKGICGCQMDLKVDGLPYDIMLKALLQAKEGRLHILGEMSKTLAAPREDYKAHAPRIVKMRIAREFIGAIIGTGGKVIQEMQRTSGATISIVEEGEEGVVEICSPNKASIDMVVARIKGLTTVPEIGATYDGVVKNIQAFGAFVEILPGKDGLLHISEISWDRIETMEGVLKEGDKIQVKLLEVDGKTGKMRLSRKALLERPERQKSKA